MIPSAPTFKKIILLLKDTKSTDDIVPTIKITHEDCAMIITGDYVIITEEQHGNDITEPSTVIGKIYELKEIDSYKLFKN